MTSRGTMNRILIAAALLVIALAGIVGCGTNAPEADFDASPLTAYAPEEVQFTDLSQGNVTSWAWDFDGDGVVDSVLQNPQYEFANPGNYTISLTVSGADGNDTEIKAEYIELFPCPDFIDFIAETTSMHGRHPIQFTDLSSPDPSLGTVTGWKWDFNSDDRIDSMEQNPKYTYMRNGIYSVTLTVTTAECEDTLIRNDYITITGCST
jgi:PKD repeat protein